MSDPTIPPPGPHLGWIVHPEPEYLGSPDEFWTDEPPHWVPPSRITAIVYWELPK